MLSTSKPLSSSSASVHPSSLYSVFPQRKQQKKMSITQTYFLAQTARGKLAREAAQADHDLRLLVGHANLLDSVMLELAEAEQEQERWFNQSVSGARHASNDEPKHIKWADTVVEEPEDDWDPEDASDSDSESDDSDYDDADFSQFSSSLPVFVSSREVTSDEHDEDDGYNTEEDDEEITLTRTPSRQQPPELLSDSDGDSDDDSSMPPSPPQPTLDSFSEEDRRAITTTSFYEKTKPSTSPNASSLSESEKAHFFEDGYFLPQRQQHTSPTTTAQGEPQPPMIDVY
ncbi:hypothetical protein FQN54_002891 [Arachnomyces sp. PD_36]|nr:hypothetical protein FQN54_002891 [Arachnomyces sp. PD_36]